MLVARTISRLVLAAVVLLSASQLTGCESQGHSQGLLDQKRSGSVGNPYIVRDPAQRTPQNAPATQPAAPADTPQ